MTNRPVVVIGGIGLKTGRQRKVVSATLRDDDEQRSVGRGNGGALRRYFR
jgi:hypothetical protein